MDPNNHPEHPNISLAMPWQPPEDHSNALTLIRTSKEPAEQPSNSLATIRASQKPPATP